MTKAKERIETANKKEQLRRERQIRASALKDAGYSVADISKTLGLSEGTIRYLLKEEIK